MCSLQWGRFATEACKVRSYTRIGNRPHNVSWIYQWPTYRGTCDLELFAENSKFIAPARDETDKCNVQRDLSAIGRWSVQNHLPLCVDKSACLHYGNHNPQFSYDINGDIIKSSPECADLGVTRSADFSYRQHINKICLKASRLSAMLLRVFVSRDKATLMRLFNSYVRPTIEYASPIWSPTELGLRAQLERIQRRFTRRLFGQDSPDYETRLCEFGVMSLAARKDYIDLMLAFKLLHGLLDADVDRLKMAINHNKTRGYGKNIVVNRARRAYVGKSFMYRIASRWNNLSTSVKDA